MAENIIDRAALAASGAFGYEACLVDGPEQIKRLGPSELSGDDWRDVVRAVLRAIREPSEAMLDAGCDIIKDLTDGMVTGAYRPDAIETWKAMIDAALGEG